VNALRGPPFFISPVVTGLAQPLDIKRLAVVVMVAFDSTRYGAAPLAGIRFSHQPTPNLIPKCNLCSTAFRILSLPFGTHTPSQLGAMGQRGTLAVVLSDTADVLDPVFRHVVTRAVLALTE
jgi:hypothetical protein